MSEIKRNFSKARMSKDLDERLIPIGEYKEAHNVQVSTSDGSDVGSLQALLSNKSLFAAGHFLNSATSVKCVGVVAEPVNNKIYALFKAEFSTYKANYVICFNDDEFNNTSEVYFADYYDIKLTATAAGNASNEVAISGNLDKVKEGSTVRYNIGGTLYKTYVKSIQQAGVYPAAGATGVFITLGDDADIVNGTELTINLNESVLELDHPISAINVVTEAKPQGTNIKADDMLFWTDGYTEPKKINLTQSWAGTNLSDRTSHRSVAQAASSEGSTFPTLIIHKDDQGAWKSPWKPGLKVKFAQKENVTVIKRGPNVPPSISMSSTTAKRVNSAGVENLVITSINTNLYGLTGSTTQLTFLDSVDYRPGDILQFNFSEDDEDDTVFEARAQVLPKPDSEDGIYGNPPEALVPGPYTVVFLSVSSEVPDGNKNYVVSLYQDDPLFEFKFPRFAYRYKYVDGQYSTFSPWSEVAFLPGNFDYEPKKGYNLGMTNTVRSITLKDYAPEHSERPDDVVAIDVLYKEDSSPTVYVLKTVTPKDIDVTNLWPQNAAWNTDRGNMIIESELIHNVVEGNQILRHWDNVPRAALAQEITANRLIYANYKQNYNLVDSNDDIIKPKVQLWLDESQHPIKTTTIPSGEKSIKTMRTYQIGIVYVDKFGRETPVLADKKQGSITIKKEHACSVNAIRAKILSPPPAWAKYFKFFLKETSNEYYNLAMDRVYDAEDGNVWISFPSSERNKVQEDTFLELKKAHDSDTCVKEDAKFKILAIENEAPQFIKLDKKSQGVLINNASKTLIGNSDEGFPFEDYNFVILDGDQAESQIGNMSEVLSSAGDMSIVFLAAGVQTKTYDITRIITLASGDYKIVVDEPFGDDILFLSPAQTWAGRIDGISCEIIKKEYENKPEFDGRFFVKLYRDSILEQYIINPTVQANTVVVGAKSINFIHTYDQSTPYNTDSNINLVSVGVENGWPQTASPSHPLSTGYTWGGNNFSGVEPIDARYIHSSNRANTTGEKFWREFYTADSAGNLGGYTKIFIDQANAYEWDGDDAAGAGIWDPDDSTISNAESPGTWNDGPGSYNNGSQGIWSSGGFGFIDIGITGFHQPSFGENGDADNNGSNDIQDSNYMDFFKGNFHSSGADNDRAEDVRSFLNKWKTKNQMWRFKNDPNETVYTTVGSHNVYGILNYETSTALGVLAKRWHHFWAGANRNKLTLKFKPTLSGGFDPRNIAHDGTESTTIELLQQLASLDGSFVSDNPAVFETEPKEAVDVDIYYELARAYPVEAVIQGSGEGANIKCQGEVWAQVNCPVTLHSTAAAGSSIPAGTIFSNYSGSSEFPVETYLNFVDSSGTAVNVTLAENDLLEIHTRWGGKVTYEVHTAVAGASTVRVKPFVHNNEIKLPWYNCYSFGQGVESNRIRDDFNQSYIAKGVKASTTLQTPYAEEKRRNGFIFSGIYNSNSGVNELNQFIQALPITKDINPDYGSIQKLFNRDTNLLTLCEDKCIKVLANKDALYNADGNTNVTATNKVLGAVTPLAGDYGISLDRFSFAAEENSVFFTDAQRGAVIKATGDKVMPISELGMKDYFSDILKLAGSKGYWNSISGSYDRNKREYNVTLFNANAAGHFVNNGTATTVSYNEKSKGWVSFKSFLHSFGLSINTSYVTFPDWSNNKTLPWKHHSDGISINKFYDVQYDSSVELVFNDKPSSVKSFATMNYEGTKSKITAFTTVNVGGVNYTDAEYYNLNDETGWYVERMNTDLQTGVAAEFKNKEGKWFSVIKGQEETIAKPGDHNIYDNNYSLDTSEFIVQGIGMANISIDDTTERFEYVFGEEDF